MFLTWACNNTSSQETWALQASRYTPSEELCSDASARFSKCVQSISLLTAFPPRYCYPLPRPRGSGDGGRLRHFHFRASNPLMRGMFRDSVDGFIGTPLLSSPSPYRVPSTFISEFQPTPRCAYMERRAPGRWEAQAKVLSSPWDGASR